MKTISYVNLRKKLVSIAQPKLVGLNFLFEIFQRSIMNEN